MPPGYAFETMLDYNVILQKYKELLELVVAEEERNLAFGNMFCREATELGTHLGRCKICQIVNDNHSPTLQFTDVETSA